MKAKLLSKILGGVIIFSIISFCTLFLLNNKSTPAVQTNKEPPAVSFLETMKTDKEMKNKSELVAIGKVIKIKESGTKTAKSPDGLVIEGVPYIIYEVELTDKLKDQNNTPNIINVSLMDGTHVKYEIGEQYTFYLTTKNQQGIKEMHYLISYSQGIEKVKDGKVGKVDINEFKENFKKS